MHRTNLDWQRGRGAVLPGTSCPRAPARANHRGERGDSGLLREQSRRCSPRSREVRRRRTGGGRAGPIGLPGRHNPPQRAHRPPAVWPTSGAGAAARRHRAAWGPGGYRPAAEPENPAARSAGKLRRRPCPKRAARMAALDASRPRNRAERRRPRPRASIRPRCGRGRGPRRPHLRPNPAPTAAPHPSLRLEAPQHPAGGSRAYVTELTGPWPPTSRRGGYRWAQPMAIAAGPGREELGPFPGTTRTAPRHCREVSALSEVVGDRDAEVRAAAGPARSAGRCRCGLGPRSDCYAADAKHGARQSTVAARLGKFPAARVIAPKPTRRSVAPPTLRVAPSTQS